MPTVDDVIAILNDEFPVRIVGYRYDSDVDGFPYDADPNAGGAPAALQFAPPNTRYVQSTGTGWRKRTASPGTWEQEGSGTFRADAAVQLHVDPVSGDDSNDGLTESTAVQTPGRAMELAPLLGTSVGAVQVLLHPGSYGTVTISLPSGYVAPAAAAIADMPPFGIEGWASAANRNTPADERFTTIVGPFTASAATKTAGDAFHVNYTLTGASFVVDEHAGVGRFIRVFRAGVFVFESDIGENGTDYVLCPRNSNIAYTPAIGDTVYICEFAAKFTRFNVAGTAGAAVFFGNFAITGQDSNWRCVGDQFFLGPLCIGTKSGGSGNGITLEGPAAFRMDLTPTWLTSALGWTSAEQTATSHKGTQCNSNNSFFCIQLGQLGRKSLTTLLVNTPWVTWGTIAQSIGSGLNQQVTGSHHRRFGWSASQASVTINSADLSFVGSGSGHIIQRDGGGLPSASWLDCVFFSEIPFGHTFFLRGAWAGPITDFNGIATKINQGMFVGPSTVTLSSSVVHRVRNHADATLIPNIFGLALPASGAGGLDVEVGDSTIQISLAALNAAGTVRNLNCGSTAHPSRTASAAPANTLTRGVKQLSIVTVAGTTYTLLLTDSDARVRFTSATAVTVTVPANSTAAFHIGTQIRLRQAAAGVVTLVAAGGVTLNTPAGLSTDGQEAELVLTKVATDTWDITRDTVYEHFISMRSGAIANGLTRGIASFTHPATGEYQITLTRAFARNLGIISVYAGGAATLPVNAAQAKAFVSNTVASTLVVVYTGFDDGTGTGVITPADAAFDMLIMRTV